MKADWQKAIEDYEKLVRETAYRKWKDAGKPQGRDLEFWLAAEKHHESVNAARVKGGWF